MNKLGIFLETVLASFLSTRLRSGAFLRACFYNLWMSLQTARVLLGEAPRAGFDRGGFLLAVSKVSIHALSVFFVLSGFQKCLVTQSIQKSVQCN